MAMVERSMQGMVYWPWYNLVLEQQQISDAAIIPEMIQNVVFTAQYRE